jgi:acetolactate synthase I/II/III large subunit
MSSDEDVARREAGVAAESSPSLRVKGSDYIASFLEHKGVRTVFELSGGMIVHLLDSISRRGKIRILSVHHEQAAAFAADAMGRLTGAPGVAMATSGPGATNLLTGIASCYFDSSPAVFITGQVNRHEQKGDRAIRQLGFQETEIVPIARPVTKAAWQVRSPEDLPRMLEAAFELAVSGRPGPVLVDVPMDIQRIEADFPPPEPVRRAAAKQAPEPAYLAELIDALRQARRPLILAGGGIRGARATDLFRAFAGLVKVPVVKSLMAVDAIPYADPLHVGMIGSYGNRWANLALGKSDLLVVLGSRLDIRQTGADTRAFASGRTIFHVDCDAGELNNRIGGCRTAVCDLHPCLEAAIAAAKESGPWPVATAWLEEIQALRARWPDTEELKGIPGINPNEFMHQLSQRFTNAGVYVADVGQHQMWAGQSLELGETQRFLTSGGMGSMGFGLPAAIGAAMVDSSRPIVLIAGDGGFQCNIQELETVAHHRLPLKVVILNNGCHGMVRQFQQSYFEGNYQSTLWGYSAPDFVRVAEAYGLEARSLTESNDVAAAVEWLHSTQERPALLDVKIDTYANAYPKIAFGRPMTEMEPLASPLEPEGA